MTLVEVPFVAFAALFMIGVAFMVACYTVMFALAAVAWLTDRMKGTR